MAHEHVLIVDDETDILELIRYNLQKEGYRVTTVKTGEEGLQLVRELKPDVVVLDLMLPGLDGLSVCNRLKRDESTRSIPVVMLTAKAEDTDIVTGLELGADDYVTKPFSPKVLTARLRAVLRRTGESEALLKENLITVHGITIDSSRHEVSCNGEEIPLSPTEFAILEHLARTRIIDAVKGKDYPVTERSVDVQILGLRKKLGEAGEVIETVRGVGYRMKSIT
jgi:two-component system phosphate regulon response regulator PhoB